MKFNFTFNFASFVSRVRQLRNMLTYSDKEVTKKLDQFISLGLIRTNSLRDDEFWIKFPSGKEELYVSTIQIKTALLVGYNLSFNADEMEYILRNVVKTERDTAEFRRIKNNMDTIDELLMAANVCLSEEGCVDTLNDNSEIVDIIEPKSKEEYAV